jgi:3'5'-cyclic nucleotide phosphodiesterase family protein
MSQLATYGDLPKIIGNEDRLYEGDLIPYFRVLFFKLSNSENPYHNFRHTLHVLWLCYDACGFYRKELSPRRMRSLLIAALFHDFNHPGHTPAGEDDPDRTNIPIAIDGLREHILPEDRALLREIEAIIEATHFPYKVDGEKLDLLGKIIRDADLAQALSSAWGVKPLEVLRLQPQFLSSLRFNTEWARRVFPPQLVQGKVEEAEKLLRLLETEPDSQVRREGGSRHDHRRAKDTCSCPRPSRSSHRDASDHSAETGIAAGRPGALGLLNSATMSDRHGALTKPAGADPSEAP